MRGRRASLLQGTLDLLILKALSTGELHGLGVSRRIEQITGGTFVVQAGPEFKLLGKNSLNEMSLSTPAIARGSLILRTQSKLYRIARRAS